MCSRSYHSRLLSALIMLALSSPLVISAQSLRADPATKPAPDAPKPRPNHQAIMQEILAQPQGIHALTDGSICIKSGPGMAHVHDNGRGCGTGCNINPAPVGVDGDLMAGVFFALFMHPKEGEKLGIGADQAVKIKDAYNYMDVEHTYPPPVLKLYNQYAKSPEGKARTDAEKALMDRVRSVGQAYIDVEAKKVKDVKALLTADQIRGLRLLGGKMIRPFEKPIA